MRAAFALSGYKSFVAVTGTLMVLAIVLAGCAANAARPPFITPSNPTADAEANSRKEAIKAAIVVSQSWGEDHPQVLNVTKETHADFVQRMAARGETVAVAGTGDLWIVDLRGTFVPNRIPRDVTWHCASMFVAIQGDNNEVIGAGCRDTISGTATAIASAPPANSSTLPFFPRQKDPHPDSMAALLVGKLVVADGCIRVITSTGRSYLAVWPLTFSLQGQGNMLEIIGWSGQRVGQIGGTIKLGGGVMTGDISRYLLDPLPESCSGPYWIVANVPVDGGGSP